ncbi:MAG: Lrp/AsnC family transcriptional regulator [Candidatus Aureabacteria bacterium]|nr:Lrp/AsnC family transcriptional regulator [Candidatus Auribacterota bacterium]
MDEILEILQKDANADISEISAQINIPEEDVRKKISEYKKKGIIIKYKAVINQELINNVSQDVTALIEVKVTPQKNKGFDSIAKRVYNFPEVVSCFLLSGGYDLFVIVKGRDHNTISNFVSEKLAPMENIIGTETHFILKKYKDDGDVLVTQQKEESRPIISA